MKKQAVNPYLPGWEYIPDGEPRLFDGRVYVFGSHDEARGKNYCTGDYVCWSAPAEDLASWSFEGVIYRRVDDPAYPDGDEFFAAPDVARGPDGRYYLYYFSTKMEKIGVAVCDTPAGHYRFYGNVHFSDGKLLTRGMGFGQPFDPAVLVDDSGNWLYYGFALQKRKAGIPEDAYQGGFVTKLEDDMLTICQKPVRTIPGKMDADGTGYEGHAFLEASSIRRYGGLYYLVYSSEQGHELCYATSRYPDRDFAYRGVIVSNGDIGLNGRTEEEAVYYPANNHGGLVQAGEQMYIFYHRHTHGIQYSRQGCAEPVKIERDGSVAQAEITSCGLNGGPLMAKGEYSAHLACHLRSREGILHYSSSVHWNEAHPYIAQEAEGGAATLQNQYIYNLRDGAACGFKYFLFDGTEKKIGLRVRGAFEGEIQVLCDSPEGTLLASVTVSEGEKWHWVYSDLSGVTGSHALYFRVRGTGSCDFDSFSIEQ